MTYAELVRFTEGGEPIPTRVLRKLVSASPLSNSGSRACRLSTVAFILYDVETTGLNKHFDQILQFAAVRTDVALVETGRFETRSRLMPHVVPSPRALHVTGMSVEVASSMSRLSHYAMVCEIADKLSAWCPATFLGFNSIRFDEENHVSDRRSAAAIWAMNQLDTCQHLE
jgi:hypothetical protein